MKLASAGHSQEHMTPAAPPSMTDALKAGRYELWRSYCEIFASTVCRVSGPPGLPSGYHFPSKELASKCLRVETPCKYLGSDPFCNPRVYSAPNAPQRSGSSDGVSKLRPQRGCQDTCVSLAAFIRSLGNAVNEGDGAAHVSLDPHVWRPAVQSHVWEIRGVVLTNTLQPQRSQFNPNH